MQSPKRDRIKCMRETLNESPPSPCKNAKRMFTCDLCHQDQTTKHYYWVSQEDLDQALFSHRFLKEPRTGDIKICKNCVHERKVAMTRPEDGNRIPKSGMEVCSQPDCKTITSSYFWEHGRMRFDCGCTSWD